MRRQLSTFLLLLITHLCLASALGQESLPIPTLAVPTLVAPAIETTTSDSFNNKSAVAEILESGVFRVGILYNQPPYSEFTLQGEFRGFNVELLRLLADTWGLELELIQVTRQNALDKLNQGAVHVVASAFVHYRDLDAELEFSQTYLLGRQAMMVRADSPFKTPAELGERKIGYVIGTRTEKALSLWSARMDRVLNLQHYLTLDRAFAALTRGDVAAIVAEEQGLLRISDEYAEQIRILEAPVITEPHAFAVRRQDAALRDLLNHSIQLLLQQGELGKLHREYFPNQEFPADTIALWDNIAEELNPAGFPSENNYPPRAALPQILESGLLRVAGIVDGGAGASAGERRLAELNRALVSEMASRWGVGLEIVNSSAQEAADLLRTGAVQLVAGSKPDWRLAGAMDFSMPYLLHGDRLMVPANSGIEGFNNLRGRVLGLLIGDETARERAQAWADSIRATLRYFQSTESGAASTLLEFNNANAIYADSLALIAHLEANPNSLKLTERWYSRSYYSFALPENDLDFRLLVDYTLQELIQDGTLFRLSAPLLLSDELPSFPIIPGLSEVAGINLSAAPAGSAPAGQ